MWGGDPAQGALRWPWTARCNAFSVFENGMSFARSLHARQATSIRGAAETVELGADLAAK